MPDPIKSNTDVHQIGIGRIVWEDSHAGKILVGLESTKSNYRRRLRILPKKRLLGRHGRLVARMMGGVGETFVLGEGTLFFRSSDSVGIDLAESVWTDEKPPPTLKERCGNVSVVLTFEATNLTS